MLSKVVLMPKSSLLSRSRGSERPARQSITFDTVAPAATTQCIANFFLTVESLATLRVASPIFIVVRSTRSHFRSRFPPGTRPLNGMTRRRENPRRESVTVTTTDGIPVLYSAWKPARQDTIKNPVLSRARLSSFRMSGGAIPSQDGAF